FTMIDAPPERSFALDPRPEPTEAVNCFAILGPFPGINPSILSDGEHADSSSRFLNGFDEFSHIANPFFRQQRQAIATNDIHSSVHQEAVMRFFFDAGETSTFFKFAHSIWDS